MAPSRFASLRGRSRPRHIPSLSADDAALQLPPQPLLPLALVALRYEETAQAEPPIPIPPPRNPLRINRASLPSSAASVASAASSTPSTPSAPSKQRHRHTLQPQPHITVPSPSKPSQHSTAALPPLPPLPPLRCSTTRHSPSPSSSTACTDDWRRDSALGSTTLSSPTSSTLPEDYASSFHQTSFTAKSGTLESPTSLYSTDSEPDRLACDRQPASRIHSPSVHNEHDLRYPCESRWSFSDAGDSDSHSFNKEASSTRRLIRGLSVKLAPPMRRLKKQSPGDAAATVAATAVTAAVLNLPATDSPPTPPPPTLIPTAPPASQARDQAKAQAQAQAAQARLSRESHQQSTDTMTLALDTPPLQPALSLNLPDPVALEIGGNDMQSPLSSTNPRPLSDASGQTPSLSSGIAPSISTNIPLGHLLDDNDLDNINFSNRGSVYFGGIRAISAPSAPPERAPAPMDRFLAPRAAPAAPVHRTSDGTAESKTAKNDGKPGWRRHAKKTSLPDIRVMSEDTKRESQKVRSLYESGDLVRWEDGAPGRQSGELLEPPVEAPSEGDGGNIAIKPTKENRKSVRAMYLSPTSPLSVTSLPSPRGSFHRHEYELAGGIEDWEDVQGADVDRYGFIMVPSGRPGSRASVPAETRSLHTSYGRHSGRNVLTKRSKGPPLSQGLTRIPSRKVSARSLNTQASGYSIQSRRSVRSSIRTAANMLPYNRDRRIIDAAVDMLSLPPGLADADEEQKSPQAIKAAQDREARRTEKWRNMAKLVTHGKDNKGDKFATNDVGKIVMKMTKKKTASDTTRLEIDGVEVEFDTKNPKLIERTWKGIPDRWRSSAWYSFLATSARSAECQVSDRQLMAHFHTLQGVSSPDDVQIDLDVPRTINRHIMFRKRYRGGQRLLFRVLHALSLYFPDVGYVQGMAPLAASLLCYYDEERCFVMLVWLWQFRGLERLYEHGFGGLMIALQDLEKHWLKGKPISQKLNELGVDPTAYGTRWYLTLFNLAIPFPVQLRVWDVFMLLGGSPSPAEPSRKKDKHKEQVETPENDLVFEGLDIIHATAAALIDVHKDVIMSGDFENVMKGLTSFQSVTDEDKFIELVRAEWNIHRGKKKG